MRRQIPEGNPWEDDKEQRGSKEVRRLRNLVNNLEMADERVCVTWLIFKLRNTSGDNYIFILGRSSTVEVMAMTEGGE